MKLAMRAEKSSILELMVLAAFLAGSNIVATLPSLIERSWLGAVGSAESASAALMLGLVAGPLAFAQSILAFAVTPIARAMGAGDRHLAARLTVQNLWLALLFGAVFLAVAQRVDLIDAGQDELTYLHDVLEACLPYLLMEAACAGLTAQSAGANVLTVHALWCATQIAWCIIFVPSRGLVAAGQARFFAAWTAAVLALILLSFSRQIQNSVASLNLRPNRTLMVQILRGGAGNAMSVCLLTSVSTGFLFLVRRSSVQEAAAIGIGFAAYAFAFSGVLGLSQAFQTVLSRRLGEGQTHLHRAGRIGLALALVFAVVTAFLLWTAGLVLRAFGGIGRFLAPASSLPTIFLFLGFHVFGDALCATFAAALRSASQFGRLCGTTLILGATLIGGVVLASWLHAGSATYLVLLCLYSTAQGIAALLHFKRMASRLDKDVRAHPAREPIPREMSRSGGTSAAPLGQVSA